MCIKNALIGLLFLFLPTVLTAQIHIDDVGDGWVKKVDSALSVIKKYDQTSYSEVTTYCNHISFWLGNFSTTQYPSSIIIAVNDIKINSINNLACLIVHETIHLKINKKGVNMSGNEEEVLAYISERDFATKISNIEPWILFHIDKQIELHKTFINKQ